MLASAKVGDAKAFARTSAASVGSATESQSAVPGLSSHFRSSADMLFWRFMQNESVRPGQIEVQKMFAALAKKSAELVPSSNGDGKC